MLEINLWNPDDNGQIQRSDRIPDTTPGISRFQQVVLHQGRIERFFLDSIAEHSDIRVERGILPESMKFDVAKADDDDAYPIEVTLRHLTEEEATPRAAATSANGSAVQDGLFRSNLTPDDTADLLAASKLKDKAGSVETIRAKYVVGCDGAHSWVRNWLGYELRGVRTCQAQHHSLPLLTRPGLNRLHMGCTRYHPNYRFPRHQDEMRYPQRRVGQPDGHPQRERISPTVHTAHYNQPVRRQEGRSLDYQSRCNPGCCSENITALQDDLQILRLVDRIPNRTACRR